MVKGSLAESERQKIIGEVEAQPISAKTVDEALGEIPTKVLCAFHDRGYYRAVVYDATLLSAHDDSHQLDVSVEVPDIGAVYRLEDLRFTNAREFSPNEIRALFPIRLGDVFSRKLIASGLENMKHLYGKKGYLLFTSVPDIKIDEQKKTIALNVNADEGPVFHVGVLIVEGEESVPGARKRLLEAWKPFEGQVCDLDSVTAEFLKRVGAGENVRADEILRTDWQFATHSVNFRIRLVNPSE
jgi:outer membrane translocation and assembly module TamA